MHLRRLARLLVGLPVAATIALPALAPATAHATTQLGATWTKTIIPAQPMSTSDPADPAPQPYSSPAVGDLFGNGGTDVVAAFPDGSVWAWDANGNVLSGWPVRTTDSDPSRPGTSPGEVSASPTLAPLDPAQPKQLDIVVPSRDGYVFVFRPDGTWLPGWPQHSLYGMPWANLHFVPDFFASAAVGDLFGDGRLEVVTTSWDHRLYAWYANGTPLSGFPINLWDTVWDTPTLVNLENSRQLDIVVGSDSSGASTEPYPRGGVWWAFRPNGTLLPGWPRIQDEVPWSSPAAGALNPGEAPTVVAGTGHWVTAAFHDTNVGKYVQAFTAWGATRLVLPTGKPNFSSPALGDLFGDGRREIVEASEDGSVYAWDPNGNLLPGWPVTPNGGTQLGSVSIAPVPGCAGANGVWIPGWYHILGYCAGGGNTPAVELLTGPPPPPGVGYPVTAAPTVAVVGGRLSVVDEYQLGANPMASNWAISVWPIPGANGLNSGSWPTFHGSMTRSGTQPLVADAQNRVYVSNLYHDVLQRQAAPSSSELDWWEYLLDRGASWAYVAQSFVTSDEAHGFIIDGDYNLMLGRPPDAAGRAYWVSQLAKGVPNEVIIGQMGGSPEFIAAQGSTQNLVEALYTLILGRTPPPTDTGVQFWVHWIQDGHPASQLATMFAESHEYHVDIVSGWYLHYLGRPGDPTGLQFWADYLDAGHSDDAGIVNLVASPEYYGHSLASF